MAASQCGNEPGFVTSFAAGVAVRFQTFGATGRLTEQVLAGFKTGFPGVWEQAAAAMPANLRLATLDIVATQSGGGVGDCGGGPLRVIFGDHAQLAAMGLKTVCLVLPTLHASMWLVRALGKGGSNSTDPNKAPTKKSGGKSTSKLARFAMAAVCWAQCFFIATHNFHGIQGHMAGFWVMLLLGAIWESLLCTYDIRGQGRQLLYLIIFILL